MKLSWVTGLRVQLRSDKRGGGALIRGRVAAVLPFRGDPVFLLLMTPDWYYAQNNEQRGPVTGPELLALERSGLLQPSTLVWRAGLAQWQPWSTVAASVRAASEAAAVPVEAGGRAGEEVAVCAYSGQTRPIALMAKYGDRWIALEHKEAFLQSLREGAPVARMAGVGELQYVGFWWRVLALIIDGFVLVIPNMLVAAPYYYLTFKKAIAEGGAPSVDPLHEMKSMDALTVVAWVGSMVGGFLIAMGYETWMVGKWGGTVGKLVLGARVARPSGEPLGYLHALGRYGAKLLNGLIWAAPAYAALIIGAIMSFGTGLQSGTPKEVPVAMIVGVIIMFLWFLVGGFGYYMAGWTAKKQALHDKLAKTVVVKKNPV